MKLVNCITISLFQILVISQLSTVINSLKYTLLEKLLTERGKAKYKKAQVLLGAGVVRFARDVLADRTEESVMPPVNCDYKSDTECRGIYEQIVTAYEKAKRFEKLISFPNCRKFAIESAECKKESKAIDKAKSIYFIDKLLNLTKGGISRYTMGMTPHNDDSVTDEIGETILFKVCMPTDKKTRAYLDFRCPNSPCTETFDPSLGKIECLPSPGTI
jgi:hypothetical protein